MIYLDNAATTPVDTMVFLAMKPYFLTKYGNASEYHIKGQEARMAIEKSRETISTFLGAHSDELIFTSCATESINLSHKGLLEGFSDDMGHTIPHVITTAIEHKAVLETLKHLVNQGRASVTILPVDKQGMVSIVALKKAIKKETRLVSVMYVNNEVGTIQPIRKIGLLIKALNKNRDNRIYFHTDATQAVQYLNCRTDYLGVDLLSFTGHKIYAPKGIGALYVRQGTPIVRQMDGGSQERVLRAGTENTPHIVALGRAIEMVSKERENESERVLKLRDMLINGIMSKLEDVKVTSHFKNRIPHIASFIVLGVEGEAMVLRLSAKGIFVSSGSACAANDLSPSHVLSAMGYPEEDSHGSIRFSLGRSTTVNDIDTVLKHFPKIVKQLRALAPEI
jgi:cysteine desulfurase